MRTCSGKTPSSKQISPGAWPRLNHRIQLRSTKTRQPPKNIAMASTTIHCWKSKPKLNPSRRSNDANSSSNSSKLSTQSPKRINPRETTEERPPSRTTRIIQGKLSARRILKWQPKKTERYKRAAAVKIPNPMDSKNNMAMSRRKKG